MHIIDGSIKIFTFCHWSIDIIFTSHYLKVFTELTLNILGLKFIWRIRVNRLATIPIIPKVENTFISKIYQIVNLLGFFLEETVITDTIRRRFVYVLNIVSVLMRSASLVEEFLILSMVGRIILAISHVSSVIPCWCPATSWIVNTIIRKVMISNQIFFLILTRFQICACLYR